MTANNRLRRLREASELSREELAARLRPQNPFHTRTIYRWEIGETRIPEEFRAFLADLFGVSISHLMGYDDIEGGRNGRDGNGIKAIA